MEQFVTLCAVAAPMPLDNINTDDIYPGPAASPIVRGGKHKEFLSDRTKMGINAFAAQRWTEEGTPLPDFVLNRAPYDRAQILIAGRNFGCGSSREMAVWALMGIGIRCIVAPSFGDIFAGNCFKNGVLPIQLANAEVAQLMEWSTHSSEPILHVDLQNQSVQIAGGETYRFEVGAYHKTALLKGLDEIAATLERLPEIEVQERAYYATRPWLAEGRLTDVSD
jgi:3-isopropylmalate/(R)-2-methylmalate dehydratase small subunit